MFGQQQQPKNRRDSRAEQRGRHKAALAQPKGMDPGARLKMMGKSEPYTDNRGRGSKVFKWAAIAGVVVIVIIILAVTANWLSLIMLVAGTGLGVYIGRSTKR